MIPLGSKSAREGPNGKRLVIASSKEAVELVTQVRPQSQMAESYRALRTSLLLSNLGAPPQGDHGDQRPAAGRQDHDQHQLLRSCWPRKGVRVLLIDADLRRPSIHKTLGMGPRSGLQQRVDRQRDSGADALRHYGPAQSVCTPCRNTAAQSGRTAGLTNMRDVLESTCASSMTMWSSTLRRPCP